MGAGQPGRGEETLLESVVNRRVVSSWKDMPMSAGMPCILMMLEMC